MPVTAVTTPTTHHVLSSTYGVGISTIGRYLGKAREFMKPAGLPADPDGVRQVLAAMRADGKLQRMGGARLFTDDEEAILMGITTAHASAGAGMHRDLCRAVFREAAHSKGAAMARAITHADHVGKPVLESERAKAVRLQAANINPKTYQKIKVRVNKGGLLGGVQGGHRLGA